jgi:hypothetical protein
MACPSCTDLCVEFPIRSPGELRKVFSVVADNLQDGTIEEIPGVPEIYGDQAPFLELQAGAAFGDFVACRFHCTTCAEIFSLLAETYHGSGGSWRPERSEAIHVAL